MTFAKGNLRAVASGTEESRVEALRQWLGYPLKQKDPQGGSFWFLRPGEDEEEAEETCPIAIGFYSELNGATDEREIQRLLTSKQWQDRIYGHYVNRTSEHQPVMYVLLPTEEGTGRVPLVLPTEGGLRQRNIQAFTWGSSELETRLNRIRQGELPIASKALTSIPLVERAFYEPIKTAKELAQLLAKAAREIERVIPKVYKSEEKRYPASKGEEGYLHKLLKSFQQELLPTLRLDSENEKDYSFADIYAQTIAYALFTARVFSYVRDRKEGHKKETLFDRETAWQQLPETNPFLRRLFQDVSEQKAEDLGDELIGHIADIFAILRAAKMEVILQDFRQKMNREDIVIRFYEDFLAAYKPEMRERRGVYYTPEPVVSYMVRSVDVLLKEKFNKPLGLADPEVMILDPACGTGTFLLWICQLIHQRFHVERKAIIERVGDISWSDYVKDHLLPRIFGFELLMAPYAIAHLKLGLFLEESGYQIDSGKRLEIYLTNSLETTVSKAETLFEEFIADEAEKATEIKRDKPISVVVGNPPYSALSANLGEQARRMVEPYRYVDGVKIIEKGALQFEKNIQDDYVKFFAFSQNLIGKVDKGIVGLITNHGFLDALTLRGLRNSLIKQFNDIYMMDLHGSAKRKLQSKDENIFDIQQGIAISLLVKKVDSIQLNVSRFDVVGTRENKQNLLLENDINSLEWISLSPNSPNYLFVSQNKVLGEEYIKYPSLTDIITEYSSGTETGLDALMIAHTSEELKQNITFFTEEISQERIRDAFGIKGGTGAKLLQIRDEFKQDFLRHRDKYIRKFFYRPFDTRSIYYKKDYLKTNSQRIMQHLEGGKENIALIAFRQQSQNGFNHTFVTNTPGDKNAVSLRTREINYYFPLYLYLKNSAQLELENIRYPNISKSFMEIISKKLGYTPTPENIFYYIYAIFHSPTYRTRYAEFLKIDFPRVPLTRNDALFRQLATYGEELVALHLMKSPKLDNFITQFVNQGGKQIVDPGHPKYANGKVTINKKGDGFTGVPEEVWNFYVGGYPVCAKWLKDRKGRTLSAEDIAHYQRIVVALQETIHLMQQIDAAIPGFPIE